MDDFYPVPLFSNDFYPIFIVKFLSSKSKLFIPKSLLLIWYPTGISTSLLFSVFESWMVCEHHKHGFDSNLLGETFSYATLGNGLVAVVAGLVANTAAESYGFVAPFVG